MDESSTEAEKQIHVSENIRPEDFRNSAFWHIQRFYHRLLDHSKVYGKSVTQLIREAKDEEELKNLLEREWPGASAGTRRKWARAAEAKFAEFDRKQVDSL